MGRKYWRVRGYRRFDEIFNIVIPIGSITEANIIEFLKCLAAKELQYEEMVGAYVKRKTRKAHEILHITKNGPFPEYNCGHDPSFVAIIVDEKGDRIKYPSVP